MKNEKLCLGCEYDRYPEDVDAFLNRCLHCKRGYKGDIQKSFYKDLYERAKKENRYERE